MNAIIETPAARAQRAFADRTREKPAPVVMKLRGPSGNMRVHKVKPLTILMVEDNPTDAMLTRMAFDQCAIPGNISDEITDGNSAMHFLRQSKYRKDGREPDAVLLDLGLPERNGFEVLSDLNEDPKLCKIPIIILTGFGHYDYLKSSYKKLNIITYLQKPCAADDMQAALEKVVSRKYK